MKVMMVASEALPFSKTGGLGDVVSSLSGAMTENGLELRLFIPCTEENRQQLGEPLLTLKKGRHGGDPECRIYRPKCEHPADIYLIEEETLLTRKGVYGEDNSPYSDNCHRYALFCRAALDAAVEMQWRPDIIHTHDWPTGLIASYLKTDPWRENFKECGRVFSIHNLGYQGEFSTGTAHTTLLPGNRIPFAAGNPSRINLMAGALKDSHKITTVSPTYAQEILTEERSHGLASVLKQRRKDLSGILNGIDLDKWNPEKDPRLASPYSSKNLQGKENCKKALLKEFGLKGADKPLIAMITRLADQKGIREAFDPQEGAVYRICNELNLNFIIVGTGEPWCEAEIERLNKLLPNFHGISAFNEELSHRVEAGSDFFLMPSRYEPCGLNQMYSSRYGTIPIVRHTGGLADTVTPYTGWEEEATGYSFFDLTPDAIYGTVKWALEVMSERPAVHRQMISNGMERDFSWQKSAEAYQDLYQDLIRELKER